jgi:tRNA(adenine34) deaminase
MAETKLNHHCEVSAGVLAEECGAALSDFFKQRRKNR